MSPPGRIKISDAPSEIFSLRAIFMDSRSITYALPPRSSVTSQRPSGVGSDAYTEVDRKSTRLNSSHVEISYAVFCLKKKNRPSNFSPTITHTNAAALRHRPHHKISAEREPLVRPNARVPPFGQKPALCSNHSLREVD